MTTRSLFSVIFILAVQGCSIVTASYQPLSRPPEELVEGGERDWIDHKYGYPIATGFSEDGVEYVEQIQFVDGVPMGWKVFRIVLHSVADSFTCFLWEFIGFPMELALSNHSEYVYYLVYDENNQLIRTIPEESIDGQKLSKQDWASPRLPTEKWARVPSVPRMTLDERVELTEAAKKKSRDKIDVKSKTKKVLNEELEIKLSEIKKLHDDKVIDGETYKMMLIRLANQ